MSKQAQLCQTVSITIQTQPQNTINCETMTCYLRHLGLILVKADITLTKENRKQVGCIIQTLVGEPSDCPAVWKKVKQRLAENEDGFIAELKTAYKKQAAKN